MKKSSLNLLLVLIVIFGAFSFLSCGGDDKESDPQTTKSYEEMLIGTWEVTYNTPYETATDIITFNKNKTFEAVCSLSVYNGTYSFYENTISFSEQTGKFSFNVINIKNMTEKAFNGVDMESGEIVVAIKK